MKIKRFINGEFADTRPEEREAAEAAARKLHPKADQVRAGLYRNGSEVYVEVWDRGACQIYAFEGI